MLLVATDLDGTLLDEETYAWRPAQEALERLRAEGVPLVVASSKTAREVAALAQDLGPIAAAIVENGGAIQMSGGRFSRPPEGARLEGDTLTVPLGLERPALVAHLSEIGAELGTPLRGFASMSADEIAARTGLTLDGARLAADRDYDEPFVTEDAVAFQSLADAAARRGLAVTRGGRFFHLTAGWTDKGRALRRLLALHEAEGRRFTTVGLGDAGNDLPLLRAVDRPVIVPRRAGIDRDLAAGLARAEVAPWPGPAGWNAAVLTILAGAELPRVAPPSMG